MTYPDWEWGPDWCAIHHRPEAYKAWFVCGECLHSFRWRASLWARHLGIWWQLGRWRALRHLFDRPSRVATCPLCAHDF